MEGFRRQAVTLSLISALKNSGSWCGETHVQKCGYFLQEGLGTPLDLAFFLYKHGPFSFELRELLGEMRANLFIDIESRPPFGGSLVVTSQGADLMSRFPKSVQECAPQIQFVADRLARKSVVQLERLGTALYVNLEYPEGTLAQQATRITELKPHISREQAELALREVAEFKNDARSAD